MDEVCSNLNTTSIAISQCGSKPRLQSGLPTDVCSLTTLTAFCCRSSHRSQFNNCGPWLAINSRIRLRLKRTVPSQVDYINILPV
jgi:hypothetical protein